MDRSFEVTFLFSMFGLVMSLLLVRLPFLEAALQEEAGSFVLASIESPDATALRGRPTALSTPFTH